ncbi:hypothetical protein EBR66_04270 [bacterium]|nr:hypothetical protein [bacterium]
MTVDFVMVPNRGYDAFVWRQSKTGEGHLVSAFDYRGQRLYATAQEAFSVAKKIANDYYGKIVIGERAAHAGLR